MLNFNELVQNDVSYIEAALKQSVTLQKVVFNKVGKDKDIASLTLHFINDKKEIAEINLMSKEGKSDAAVKILINQVTHLLKGVYGETGFKPEWLQATSWEELMKKWETLFAVKCPIKCEVKLVLQDKTKKFVTFPAFPPFFSTEINPTSDRFKVDPKYDFFRVEKTQMDSNMPNTEDLPQPEFMQGVDDLPFNT